MSEVEKEVAEQRDPMLDFPVTLNFTIDQVNGLLNILGQLPFLQCVGAITEIQNQCAPQIAKYKESIKDEQ